MTASALAGALGSQQAAEEIEPQDKKAYNEPSCFLCVSPALASSASEGSARLKVRKFRSGSQPNLAWKGHLSSPQHSFLICNIG